jgi:hypothetical protein
MAFMDADWQLDFEVTPIVTTELAAWNIASDALNLIRLKNIHNIGSQIILEIPLLTAPFKVIEAQILNHLWMKVDHGSWLKSINYELFDKIVLIHAYRIALSSHTDQFMVSKKLPGGWGIDRKNYNLFIKSINKNPTIDENLFMTKIIAKAGMSSIPNLITEVSKINYKTYLDDLEICANQMTSI